MKHLRTLAALFGALLLAAIGAASPALAANNLTMTSPTYDTTGEKWTTCTATSCLPAALSGGYGSLPAPTAIYSNIASFRMEGWVKTSSTTPASHFQAAFGAPGRIVVGAAASTGYALYNPGTGASVTSSVNIADGNWHFIRFVSSSSGTALYVDGALAASSSTLLSATTPNSNTGFSVHEYTGSIGTYSWVGDVDEVAIFNDTAQTNSVPTGPYAGTETNLAELYHLDQAGTDCAANACPAAGTTFNVPVSSAAFHFSPLNWKGDTGRAGSAYRQSWNNGAYFTFVWNAAASNPYAAINFGSTSTNQVAIFVNGVLQGAAQAPSGTIALSGIIPGASNTVTVFLNGSSSAGSRWGQAQNGGNTATVTGVTLDNSSSAGTAPVPSKYAWLLSDSIGEGLCAGSIGSSACTAATGGSFINSHFYYLGLALMQAGYDFSVSSCGSDGWLNPGDTSGDVPALYPYASGVYKGDSYSRLLQIDSGVSALSSDGQVSAYGAVNTPPALVVINLETNESVNSLSTSDNTLAVTHALNRLRNGDGLGNPLVPASTPILVEMPFGLEYTTTYNKPAYVAALRAGVANYQSAHPADTQTKLLDFGVGLATQLQANCGSYLDSSLCIHPNVYGSALIAGPEVQAVQASLTPVTSAGTQRQGLLH